MDNLPNDSWYTDEVADATFRERYTDPETAEAQAHESKLETIRKAHDKLLGCVEDYEAAIAELKKCGVSVTGFRDYFYEPEIHVYEGIELLQEALDETLEIKEHSKEYDSKEVETGIRYFQLTKKDDVLRDRRTDGSNPVPSRR